MAKLGRACRRFIQRRATDVVPHPRAPILRDPPHLRRDAPDVVRDPHPAYRDGRLRFGQPQCRWKFSQHCAVGDPDDKLASAAAQQPVAHQALRHPVAHQARPHGGGLLPGWRNDQRRRGAGGGRPAERDPSGEAGAVDPARSRQPSPPSGDDVGAVQATRRKCTLAPPCDEMYISLVAGHTCAGAFIGAFQPLQQAVETAVLLEQMPVEGRCARPSRDAWEFVGPTGLTSFFNDEFV
mmetsp:Transcript_94373/g.267055  ORF Transcript_94373/g.267055 Transcript_94373/m.267055 type:complete len:238 (+) Transcript_94373:993-1706(+)